MAAVALSMLVAGGIEYLIAAGQLERRSLAEAAKAYEADVTELAEVLAMDQPPAERLAAAEVAMRRLARTYGTENVVLFSSDGRLVAATAAEPGEDKAADVRDVLATGRAAWEKEEDEGEADQDNRYEFLFPIRGPDQEYVVEVDQRADIIEQLLTDLRLRKAAGLALGLLVAVPLSYLLGGRALQRRQSRAELAADTDPLTGLAGRRPFRPTLQAALADPTGTPAVLALVDVDEFKGVNDRFGHSFGDRVLCALAESFATLRTGDTAFRLGGDEFAVVLTGSTAQEAVEAIERVRRAFAQLAPGITFSCGLAAATSHDDVPLQELWERADAALYEAKHLGRRQTVSFDAMTDSVTVSALKLDAVAGLLLDHTELSVAFQPIWDLRDGQILGHEALLRLPADCPVAGPQEAFLLAKRLGLVGELDARARRAVFRAVGAGWQGLLFVNIHPDALPGLDIDALLAEIDAAGLAAEQVVLEVTEHEGLDHPAPIRVLKRAQARGLRLALDDMGAGNAGLRALTHVRFDIIKIDRQVTARVGIDPGCDATVAAAATFVQQTGGWIIAEGVEDVDMLSAISGEIPGLAAHAPIAAAQGYLLGRPGPAPLAADTRLDHIVPRTHHTSP